MNSKSLIYKTRYFCFFCALLSWVTTLGLSVNLDLQERNANRFKLLLDSMSGETVLKLGLFCAFFVLYKYMLQKAIKLRGEKNIFGVCSLILAALFSLFMVFGYSFYKTNSWQLVFDSKLQMIKAFIRWSGYFVLFSVAISCLFSVMPSVSITEADDINAAKLKTGSRFKLWHAYKANLAQRPFRTAFITIIVAYIPCAVLSYPGLFMGDTSTLIYQWYGLPSWSSDYLELIDENVLINQHHPVLYSGFIHVCLVISHALFSSYNIGIFLVALSQLFCMALVLSYSIKCLTELNIKQNIIIAVLLYYIISPRLQNYMFLISKDTFNACVFFLFILVSFKIFRQKSPERKTVLLCILAACLMCLLRNDGKYIILASVAFCLLFDGKRRKVWLQVGVSAAALCVVFYNILLPALHVTPASKREALSVPFQQTARYVLEYPDEVTAEEKAAISKALDYDALAEKYVPTKSDAVKGTYNETSTTDDLKAYFKVWLQMGLKHPGIYLQATINNYYNYFYPGAKLANQYSYNWSEECMETCNNTEAAKTIGLDFHRPEAIKKYRKMYEKIREGIFMLPVLSLLRSAAFYVWVLMLDALYLINRRQKNSFLLLLPLLFTLGVCLLGPCNGDYFRYLFGISVCLPATLILSQSGESAQTQK